MKLKRKIYIGFTMLLGVELMIILHALLESWYISMLTAADSLPARNDFRFFSTYLPIWLSALLLIGGLVGGYFLGKWWWHMVYVEKRHWRFRKKHEPHK
jgi:hypothetical protein